MLTTSPPRPPEFTPSLSTSSRAITLEIELVEIGRAIELHPDTTWSWPLAQRAFRAKADLQVLVREALK